MSSTPSAPTPPARSGTDHHTPQAVVERFLTANDALDVDGMFAEIAADATWAFPTAPAGAPAEVTGKADNRAFFEALRPVWTAFRLTRREVCPLAGDPERVIAHYASEGTLIDAAPTPTPTSASSASATGRSCTGPSSAIPPPSLGRSLRCSAEGPHSAAARWACGRTGLAGRGRRVGRRGGTRPAIAVAPALKPIEEIRQQAVLHGETRTRTGDTTIFSRVLYQLSYLAVLRPKASGGGRVVGGGAGVSYSRRAAQSCGARTDHLGRWRPARGAACPS